MLQKINSQCRKWKNRDNIKCFLKAVEKQGQYKMLFKRKGVCVCGGDWGLFVFLFSLFFYLILFLCSFFFVFLKFFVLLISLLFFKVFLLYLFIYSFFFFF